ncbi:MAG TPA: hypothetical protein VN258_01575 [Mobilitalea sp.]|nr:hypothetical protein [Mobilitalea sp.]
MIRKKSSFLTFCFSFLPGAGQMYMGFMKRGVSLMSAFFLLIFISVWLDSGTLMLAMPILWFFAFFDTFNLRAMPDDEFYAMEDDYLIIPEFAKEKTKILQSKYRNLLALVLIFVGFSMLWNNICDLLGEFLPDYISNVFYEIGRYFPSLVIGFAIIALGLYLIRGKKQDLDTTEKTAMLQDKGGF